MHHIFHIKSLCEIYTVTNLKVQPTYLRLNFTAKFLQQKSNQSSPMFLYKKCKPYDIIIVLIKIRNLCCGKIAEIHYFYK